MRRLWLDELFQLFVAAINGMEWNVEIRSISTGEALAAPNLRT